MQKRLRDPSAATGLTLGLALVVVVAAALGPFHSHLSRSIPALVFVVPVVIAAVFGGRLAAIVVAIAGAVAINLFFIPPFGTLRVALTEDVVALAVFMLIAISVGTVVASEASQRRAAERQSQEIRLLTAEQERLREEASRLAVLEQVDQERAALLRSVSHDLRTPLASIRAVASDLKDGPTLSDSAREEMLDVVCDEAERLDRIVANLLSMSRIEAGALRPTRQAVAIDELCPAVARRLSRVLNEVDLDLQVPEDLPMVDADYVQIDQVLTNLLENAARHSPPGAVVTVAAEPVDGFVAVTVTDRGTGIPPGEREHVFEPFRTGTGSTSTGIGLAICKAIVEAHGGSITVEGTPSGDGARFRFTLPVDHG